MITAEDAIHHPACRSVIGSKKSFTVNGYRCRAAKLDRRKSESCNLNHFLIRVQTEDSYKVESKDTFAAEKEDNPCLWIVSQTQDLDPSRFLVQWLAASLIDVPLVMYQTRLAQGPTLNNFLP